MATFRHGQTSSYILTIALATLLLLHPLFAVGQGFSNDRSLRELAETTRLSLARRIETPVAQLPLDCLLGRSETAPMREYLLHQQGLAIEALLATVTPSSEFRRVSNLLEKLQRDGYNEQG